MSLSQQRPAVLRARPSAAPPVKTTRALALLGALALGATTASAEPLPVSTSPASDAPGLGKVLSGASQSVFSVNATGTVTRLSGDAVRITTTGVFVPTVTISCGNQGHCNSDTITVTVTAATTARASATKFSVSGLTCGGGACSTGFVGGVAPTPASPLVFSVTAPGKNRTVSFKLPMEVTVPAAAPVGSGAFSYTVSANLN